MGAQWVIVHIAFHSWTHENLYSMLWRGIARNNSHKSGKLSRTLSPEDLF